jgi:hypothetical protein
MIDLKKRKMQVRVIGTIVLLVLVFIAILIGISRLNFQSNTLQTACSLSIEERDAVNLGRLEFKETFPLNCPTVRVCLSDKTSSGCPNLKSTKANPVVYAQVKTKDDVARVFAETLYQDYVMTGRGEKNFMERNFLGTTYCLFTSKLTMDNLTAAKIKDIDNLSYYDVYYQMGQLKLDNGRSYLAEAMKIDPSVLNQVQVVNQLKNKKILLNKLDYDIAFSFMRAGTWKAWTAAAGMGALVVGGAVAIVVFTPVTVTIGGILTTVEIAGGAAVGAGYFTLPGDSNPDKNFVLSKPSIVPNIPEALKALNCSNVATLG